MIAQSTISIRKVIVERSDFLLCIEDVELVSGDVMGVVGTNGSGKTSFIEAILGLLTTSTVDVLMSCERRSVKMACPSDRLEVGSQIQNTSFPDEIKVGDIVKLHRLLYGISENGLYSRLEIADLAEKVFLKCSLGEKRRVELYFACAHDPVFLFLDEPTSGLDEHFSSELIRWVQSRAKESAIAFICTHSAKEVSLCNKLIWLDDGKQRYFGKKKELTENILGSYKLKLEHGSAPGYLSRLVEASINIEHRGGFDTYYGNSELKVIAADMMSSQSKDAGISISKTDDHDILQYTSGTRYV